MPNIAIEYLKKRIEKIIRVKVNSNSITLFTDTQQIVLKLKESVYSYKGTFIANLCTLDKDNLVIEYDELKCSLTVCKDFIVMERSNPSEIIDFVSISGIKIEDIPEVH